MRSIVMAMLVLFTCTFSLGQSERAQIKKALQGYIEGTAYNDADKIRSSFMPEARMFLDHPEKPLFVLSVEEYAAGAAKNNPGKYNGRTTNILSIDQFEGIAVAKLEVLIEGLDKRFIDIMLLKKLESGWKIISKTAASEPSTKADEKVLIAVSSRRTQADTEEPCGNSFSEIVEAYDVYTKAGYHVDFVSPKGGPVALAYVNSYDPLQMHYLYDQRLMHALAHTLSPSEVDAGAYDIIQFTGGSAPIFDIPHNKAIQDIAMHIYEKNKGILSAVCHGSGALANLKTSNGDYLIKGKKVNGYPNEHERKDSPYVNNAPFLIETALKQRGADFLYEKKPAIEFIQVDGRLVTGQNYQSSRGVSEKTIELSRKDKKIDKASIGLLSTTPKPGSIDATLWNYLNGRNNGDRELLEKAFHPAAELRYMKEDKGFTIWPIADYIGGVEPGKKHDCESRIVFIDEKGNAAIAKIEIEYPGWLFTDYINLLKIKDEWKIVVKTFSGGPIE